MYIPLLLAQTPQAAGGAQPNMFLALMPMVLMLGVLYMLMIRPQQKRQRETEAMVESLKKGEKVVTAGGIIGTVVSPPNKEGVVVLKIGQEAKIEILKSSISSKRSEAQAKGK